jgi:hypothetical protein
MLGIVDALEGIAERIPPVHPYVSVYFFEVYGGDLPAARQYTDKKAVGVRLFDVADINFEKLEKEPIENIAHWRDHGGQTFMPVENVEKVAKALDVLCAPFCGMVDELPVTLQETSDWLSANFAKSKCELGGGQGRAEGVVARTTDRKTIAKLRFEDYRRTLGK